MLMNEFDFDLPEDRIALRPARPRDSARLLEVSAEGAITDAIVRDLPDRLAPGDLLVRNTTFVIPAALTGVRAARDARGADVRVRVNLLAMEEGDCWRAFARPGKRLRIGDTIAFAEGVSAVVSEKADDGEVCLRFAYPQPSLEAALDAAGAPPLPPYIVDRRGADEADADDYQTVFADPSGETRSVAAPTAGLHFTPQLFERLKARGVQWADVSLAVGAGTFLPVKSESADDHVMHAEWFTIGPSAAAAVNAARREGRRVIAVGTTALRALESCDRDPSGDLIPTARDTQLFVRPGFAFAVVDGLMTNFHLPRSTLFMLVCAFSGRDTMQRAYAHAVATGYRFYSYGDASLLWRRNA
jgi:S-adenosylmethionine:tRNA ribosyltransferase-isomerase